MKADEEHPRSEHEAHHCYREKPEADDEEPKGDDRKEAENLEAARVWISGLESINR